MKRITLGLMAATVAAAIGTHTASAQGQVTNLIVATDKNATSGLETVPAGTTSLWAIFDYAGASESDFRVVLMGPGGWEIFSDDDSYSGSGRAEVEITGNVMYANIMAELADIAEATESALIKVATQQQVQDYASQAVASINQMRPLVAMVDTSGYRGLDAQQLSTLTSSMDALLDLKSEMTKATDDGTRKDVASRMEPHVATLMSAVDSLSGASVSDFPIPPSQSQTPGAEYLVKVEVDGSPADYSEFWVFGSTAQAPGSMTGGTPTTSAGSPGTSGKATLAPGSPTLASGEAPETEGVAGVVGDAAGLSSSGTIGRLGGATATPSMAGGELASPAGVDAPPAAEAPPQSVDMSGQPDKGAAAATAIVAKGVVDRIASEGGTLGGLDGGSGSGPNFAVLLVGVVVLAGVAVFMKGRM